MKDIADLCVTQIRIYPSDCLPFDYLALEANANVIKGAFEFAKVRTDSVPAVFEDGSFQYQGQPTLVTSLVVQPRKTTLKVLGNSSAAEAVHERFMELFRGLNPAAAQGRCQPLVTTQETTCVVTLDVDFENLISPRLTRFLQGYARGNLRSKSAIPTSIGLRRLSFEVRYEPADRSLLDHDVTLSKKLITVEPRAGTPLRERRFFTTSPTDSETHLALLRKLEEELSGPRKRKG